MWGCPTLAQHSWHTHQGTNTAKAHARTTVARCKSAAMCTGVCRVACVDATHRHQVHGRPAHKRPRHARPCGQGVIPSQGCGTARPWLNPGFIQHMHEHTRPPVMGPDRAQQHAVRVCRLPGADASACLAGWGGCREGGGVEGKGVQPRALQHNNSLARASTPEMVPVALQTISGHAG